MKKKTIITLFTLILIIVIAGIAYNYLKDNYNQDDTNNVQEENGVEEKAPGFTVFDENNNQITLSSFYGKPIILNFWASWCGPCKTEMPDFQKVFQEYGEDVHFVMVNLTDGQRETKEKAIEFINGSGYSFPMFFDLNMDAAYNYAIRSIPTTFIIDSNGNIINQKVGIMSESALIDIIKTLD